MIRLSMQGLKVVDREVDLEHLNLVVGPNGSGKTTIAQAIKIAALSYDPALGKRPLDTSALMRSDSLQVAVTLEDGRSFRRAINATSSGGFKVTAECSWLGSDAKDSEHKQAIQDLFGSSADEIAETLDVTQLLKASPNVRMAKFEELLASKGEDPIDVARKVMRFALLRLTETPETSPGTNKELFPLVAVSHQPIVTDATPLLLAKITDSGIGKAMDWVKGERLGHDQSVKSKVAAEKELVTKLLTIPETHPEELARLEKDKESLSNELAVIDDRRTRQARQVKLHYETTSELKTWDKMLADAQAKLSAVGLVGKDPSPPSPSDYTPVTDMRKKAHELRALAEKVELPEVPDISAEKNIFALDKQKRDLQSSSEWGEVITVADEIDEQSIDETLMPNGSPPRNWAKRLRDVAIKGLGFDPQELEKSYESSKKAFVEATTRKGEAERARATADVERIKILEQASRHDRDATNKGKEIDLVFRDAKMMYVAQEKMVEAFKTAQTRTGELRAKLEGIGTPVKDALDEDLADKKSTLERTQEAIDSLRDAVATRTSLERIVKELESARASKDVFAAIEHGLTRARQTSVTEAGRGLTDLMQKFLTVGAGVKHIPYIRADRHKCDVGWRTDEGREVPIQAMSGGEWALFAAALTSAVVSLRKAVLKFLLIEAGEADPGMLDLILRGVEAIKEGIDAIIVFTPNVPVEDHGWNVIRFKISEQVRLGNELEWAIAGMEVRS